ncbi:protein ripply3 [Ovis aries]|uniref:protein ripply3 n=1 Tax=Ovis aries TaxID=9940 RepID=UPI002952772A|nr:protein ripply3 [Ovis aries]
MEAGVLRGGGDGASVSEGPESRLAAFRFFRGALLFKQHSCPSAGDRDSHASLVAQLVNSTHSQKKPPPVPRPPSARRVREVCRPPSSAWKRSCSPIACFRILVGASPAPAVQARRQGGSTGFGLEPTQLAAERALRGCRVLLTVTSLVIQTPWRPWTLTPQEAEPTRTGSELEPGGDQETFGSKGAFGFQHPVRLYLPISKRQEYLQSSGEKVLASFPVQATIHFYNDESESEEELEEDTQLSALQREEVADASEGKARDGSANPARQPGGLNGRRPPPDPDSPEAAACLSSV